MSANSPSRNSPLRRTLGLFDATALGIGSMVGAGVFVVLSPAAAQAGPGIWVALVLAATVAVANALAVAALSTRHTSSGGAYLYGRQELGPWPGFLAGWGFVTGKTASCAAMAYTAGLYLVPDHAVPLAIGAVAALTAVNICGITRTAWATKLIVAPVAALLVFTAVASWTAPAAEASATSAGPGTGLWGVLQAAGLLFFAFAGYARVATLGEEVRSPERTIPSAIALSLGFTLLLYVALAVGLVRLLGTGGLAAAAAPVRDAVVLLGVPGWVAAAGAGLASLGALLALMAGISRTSLAMARESDLPPALGRIGGRFHTPWLADLVVAGVVAVLLLVADVTTIVGFSSFGVLVYYAVANASALRMSGRPWYAPRWLNGAGLAGCLLLAATLPARSVAAMLGVFAVGCAGRAVALGLRRRRNRRR